MHTYIFYKMSTKKSENLLYFNIILAVEYSRETWWHGSIFIMIALYTVLSPCVFAFRCKRLQRRVKKYYRCRIRGLLSKFSIHSSGKSTSESNGSFHGYGGALDKQDIALLQVKHKLMLSHHSEGILKP